MSSNDIAIRASNLSKCYHIYDLPQDRLKQTIVPRLQKLVGRQPQNYFHEFWALKDISFEVKKGEVVGIIGRNGSGKSTLLQIICGTLNPTSGTVETNGRVAALLELGSGFNPEFTGRENVYLNGTVLGLSKEEIDARYDDIAAFADIGQFIDQPVKTYSSGMFVRLAFAVVAHVDPDILVVDEALSVGDVFFQQKCIRMLHGFQNNGGTIVFVSHDTGTVLSLCNKALLLFPGGVKEPKFGDTEELCKLYLHEIYNDPERKKNLLERSGSYSNSLKMPSERKKIKYDSDLIPETTYSVSEFRSKAESFGDGGAKIIDAGFFDEQNRRRNTINCEERVRFIIKAKVERTIMSPAFGFMVKNTLGEYIYTEGTDLHFRQHNIILESGDEVIATFEFDMPHLIRGKYTMNVAFADGIGDDHVQCHWIHDAIQIDCISSRLVHGYGGMNNIQIHIETFQSHSLEE